MKWIFSILVLTVFSLSVMADEFRSVINDRLNQGPAHKLYQYLETTFNERVNLNIPNQVKLDFDQSLIFQKQVLNQVTTYQIVQSGQILLSCNQFSCGFNAPFSYEGQEIEFHSLLGRILSNLPGPYSPRHSYRQSIEKNHYFFVAGISDLLVVCPNLSLQNHCSDSPKIGASVFITFPKGSVELIFH